MIQKPAQAVDDRESQTKAAAAVPLEHSELVELAEDIGSLVLRNADTAVPHFDAYDPSTTPAADHDTAPDGIQDGVGNQVHENPFEQDEVGVDEGAGRNDSQSQSLFTRGHLESCL